MKIILQNILRMDGLTHQIICYAREWNLPKYYELLDKLSGEGPDTVRTVFVNLGGFPGDHILIGCKTLLATQNITSNDMVEFIRHTLDRHNADNFTQISLLYEFDCPAFMNAMYHTIHYVHIYNMYCEYIEQSCNHHFDVLKIIINNWCNRKLVYPYDEKYGYGKKFNHLNKHHGYEQVIKLVDEILAKCCAERIYVAGTYFKILPKEIVLMIAHHIN